METLEGTELCFPQLLNTSCKRPKYPDFEIMLIYTVLSSVSLLTVTLNLLVIISISHFKKLHTPTNLLLLSLAVSDFSVGLLVIFQTMLIDGCWLLGDLMCVITQYLACIIISSSVGNMVLISVDRYVAICDPMHYSTKVTLKTARICVYLCWSGSVLIQSLHLMDNLKQPGRYNSCFGECVVAINYIAGFTDIILTFIAPVTVIVVLYMRVFVVAVSQARAMRSHVVAVSAKKSELKAARTLGVVVVVFIICICPYYCLALSSQDQLGTTSSLSFVIYLIYLNSCLNPMIYAFFYPWFRKSVKLILVLKILQPDSSDVNIQQRETFK